MSRTEYINICCLMLSEHWKSKFKMNFCWYIQLAKDKGEFLRWSSNNASKEVWVSWKRTGGTNPVSKHTSEIFFQTRSTSWWSHFMYTNPSYILHFPILKSPHLWTFAQIRFVLCFWSPHRRRKFISDFFDSFELAHLSLVWGWLPKKDKSGARAGASQPICLLFL